ncbi:unnamed protein product [Closterium sp. NIES-53]
MAGLPGTHFLFRRQPAARENTCRDTRDSSQWQTRPTPVPPPQPVVPPVPPTPPTPPTPPAPPAPPIPPVPPAPPVPPVVVVPRQGVLQLLLPPGYSAFDAFLSKPERSGGEGSSSAPEPRLGAPADCPLDESATGADDDVEFWAADGLPEHLPIPSFPPPNKKRPHPSRDNRDARPPSPRHKPTKHRRNSYTSHEKLQWILKLEAGKMSVRRMSRESGISRRCLMEWKSRKGELEGAHGARCRLHGRGRSSWYRDMEAEVYRRFLAHRKKSSHLVSCYLVVLFFVCSRLFTALTLCLCFLFLPSCVPDCKTEVKNFWTYVRHSRRQYKIDLPWILNADQTPLWLEMPSERTVEEVGSRSVPVRSGGYQKERVTVMLACTASGEKLKPWVFFKRKTVPKGDFPSDCETEVKNFWTYVRHSRRQYKIDLPWILNADQTPLWLEMPSERTVEEVGSRSVPVRSGGYQKERVTVMLACTASEEKLKPWVFFKRKTIPKGDFPSDIHVGVHPNGWMDADGVIEWLDGAVKPYINPKFGVRPRKALLVLDLYRGHLTPEVKKKFGELNLVPAVIPAGCTSEIQPLDIAVNRSFKAAVRQLYQEWFEREGVDTLTKKGNIKKRPVELTLKWISAAWKSVPKELIQRAFLTCGISNALDGSQDKLYLQHRRDELEGEEVDMDDEIAAHGFFCNNVEEPESDSEADPDDPIAADD